MSNACLVASMLLRIGSRSAWLAFGLTRTCSSTAGHTAPTSTLDSTSSTVASAGICRLRRNTAAKNATAQMTAMHSRIRSAGITALRSV